ncbi:MAG: hypothetical protein KAH21_07030, partial [Spirochaetaceae bacterium]|nr:hypothetical protein [Spirochaetaceae bacterium]
MKKRSGDDKLGIMENKYTRFLILTGISILMLLVGGCHALKRGDFLQQTDNTMYFSNIGFLMADNPGLTR